MMEQQYSGAMTHNSPSRTRVYDLFTRDSFHENDGFSKDFLWPVWCYTVHVRMPKPSKYNIIETAVGRMLVVKHGDIKATAESLCLDADLVAFIAARLKDCMTDFENFDGTAGSGFSRKRKDGDDGEEDDSLELQSLKFFRDASGGNEILPYVIPSAEMHCREVKKAGSVITYALDNEGKRVEKLQTIPHVRMSDENKDNVKSSVSRKFIAVLERFLKKYQGKRAFSSWRMSESQLERLLRKELNVLVDDNPELVFFRVNIRLELATFEFMVSDFTGTSHFRDLSFVANKARADHPEKGRRESELSGIMKKLFNDLYAAPTINNAKKESVDMPPAVALFKEARDALKSMPGEINGEREQEQYRTKIDQFFSSCYSSLEHALYEVFRTYEEASQISQETEQKKALIKTVLQRYQINLSDEIADVTFVASTNSFRISSVHENHDMQTVLFLCICQAAIRPEHPIINLLQHHTNFICNMRNLKHARDSVSHGSNDLHMDSAELEKVIKAVSRYLGQLVIDYKKYFSQDNDRASYDLQKEVLNGIPEFADFARFKARQDLEKMLGYSFIAELDPNLTSRLMILCQKINKIKAGYKGTDINISNYQCVADMYRLLEAVFTDFVSDISHRYRRIEDELLKPQVEEFINSVTFDEQTFQKILKSKRKDKENNEHADTAADPQAGQCLCPFPFVANRSLATVNITRVVNVLRGKGASLQAAVVAYLFSRTPEQLQDLKMLMDQYDFDLIEYLEELINLRGHGINTEIKMNNVELNNIFKKFLFLFKILLND